jgi:hypothetical protein
MVFTETTQPKITIFFAYTGDRIVVFYITLHVKNHIAFVIEGNKEARGIGFTHVHSIGQARIALHLVAELPTAIALVVFVIFTVPIILALVT